jgi:hypothetical protein
MGVGSSVGLREFAQRGLTRESGQGCAAKDVSEDSIQGTVLTTRPFFEKSGFRAHHSR